MTNRDMADLRVPTMTADSRTARNAEIDWDMFPSRAYWNHNYRRLRQDDLAIIRIVGEHFAQHFHHRAEAGGIGIDVGSGSNLYPALSMLPWAKAIILSDLSRSNVAWLEEALTRTGDDGADWTWQPFWNALGPFSGYAGIDEPRPLLSERCTVRQVGIFDVEFDAYDLGTMFFVAESMTASVTEFETAVQRFLAALRSGAPFAAAFMDGSTGYEVNDLAFPAVVVDADHVRSVFIRNGADARVIEIPIPDDAPLRPGYKGMIVAVGTASTLQTSG